MRCLIWNELYIKAVEESTVHEKTKDCTYITYLNVC